MIKYFIAFLLFFSSVLVYGQAVKNLTDIGTNPQGIDIQVNAASNGVFSQVQTSSMSCQVLKQQLIDAQNQLSAAQNFYNSRIADNQSNVNTLSNEVLASGC